MTQTTLTAALRKQLDKAVSRAREVAEEAAADAIRRLAVGEARPRVPLADDAAALRRRLRAHARALGDRQEESGSLTTARLQEAAAYEIWHRMLFSRFLVERDLLRHPDLGAAMTLAELAEMAPEEGATDAWGLAERYAAATLPAVFKPGDPVLAMPLDPYHHKQLQELATGLDRAVLEADDALGWAYQFWRGAEKDRVDAKLAAGGKVAAEELPAKTQLFTEPYMVRFLLHNTLGAWWAGKVLARDPDLASTAADEIALRAACALPDIKWEFLRFVRDPADNGRWRPAAGTFPGWPERASAITVLDPCCGSGHFLVEALPILAALRAEEEGISRADAASAVLTDNLHGLELDGRCVQIASFAVALAAWRIAGAPVLLPNPHIAWVGAPPPLPRDEMAALAGGDATLRRGLEALHDQFARAPLLGSLLEVAGRDLLDEDWRERQDEAFAKLGVRRDSEPEQVEGVIAARGLLDAVGLLSRGYTLQVTNVPFLGTRAHSDQLKAEITRRFPTAKTDLAAAMMARITGLAAVGGTIALVTKHEVLFQDSYLDLRDSWLDAFLFDVVVAVGEHGFESDAAAGAFSALIVFSRCADPGSRHTAGIDVTAPRKPKLKATALLSEPVALSQQSNFKSNPGKQITPGQDRPRTGKTLGHYCVTFQGIKSGDDERYIRCFWETPKTPDGWLRLQSTTDTDCLYGGASLVVYWGEDGTHLIRRREKGQEAARKYPGVSVSQMRSLPSCLLTSVAFDSNVSPILVLDKANLPAVFAFCTSPEYKAAVRALDPSIAQNNTTLLQASFDLEHWRRVAAERYPDGLPEPYSDDPTQWLFHGHPAHATPGTALHVALARLAGYRWPAETDTGMRLSREARERIALAAALPDGDADGLLPLHAQGTDPELADRLRAVLAAAYGPRWSNALEAELVREADMTLDKKAAKDGSIESWLRDRAFRQHCVLFHDRPFLWQVWDGMRDGFSAFLHYHRLNHATLQKLTYAVLGDWLKRARDQGQTARVERAAALQQRLEAILQGEAPYDIFVRWKPLSRLPIGWEPDLEDGVRMNIRPFVSAEVLRDTPNIRWTKDRGKDGLASFWSETFDGGRVNDHHTSLAEKQASRAKP